MKRTDQQNKALHTGFRMLADALNDAGYDMKKVLIQKTVDVPWNQETVKEVLYRPIMEAMFNKESTTELDRPQVSEVWDVLNRHLGQHFGVTVEFPHEG